ncbi:peptidyl-prolyl cis-trans isomerase [Paenisporosarcina cavernae]|uniref:Peptidyl-prolyl cis-trans isomerase n=1 Tax=Paenisporosarcina cavernae TaxID=2320858 RepID=A0A385YRV8_9BACL|nr:peptidyl-prolyl cis-trans isomerase [Paenisporosarcina cavernae]AYC29120.1 peptidyl-prolyl cis-trans isomerase [Paenisporosarcina cavernae]
MERIIPIKGNVKYTITLDPTVWIFDDRKIDLTTYFVEERVEIDPNLAYTKDMSAHWSREIMEGATVPPTLKTEKKYEKTKMLTGTFGILLEPFIKNAEPAADATQLIFETTDGIDHAFAFQDLNTILLQYSLEGKPLNEDGPVYVLKTDGSNRNNPIKNVSAIRVE